MFILQAIRRLLRSKRPWRDNVNPCHKTAGSKKLRCLPWKLSQTSEKPTSITDYSLKLDSLVPHVLSNTCKVTVLLNDIKKICLHYKENALYLHYKEQCFSAVQRGTRFLFWDMPITLINTWAILKTISCHLRQFIK